MRIVALGRGFLGREFEDMGYDVIGRDELDIAINDTKPVLPDRLKDYDVIVNCIGQSNTRYCEEPQNFHEILFVNGQIPKIFSRYCSLNNKKFVHISTGCLYDVVGKPCSEEDFLATHCSYTVSKYVGERGCLLDKDIIIRPRLLFGGRRCTGHNNLIQKLLKFENYLEEYNSVTWTRTIVEAVQALLDAEQTGVFNVANEGRYTIKEIATDMLGQSGGSLSAAELRKQHGIYLVNNVMDLSKLKQFYQPPTVEEAVTECYKQLKAT